MIDLAACREVESLAVTQLPGVLVARYLGDSSEAAKRALREAWTILRPALFGRDAQAPRIWST
jgi:urease accessory protein